MRLLGWLAAIGALASAMPRWLAWPLATWIVLHAEWSARRGLARPRRELLLSPAGPPRCDGTAMDQLRVHWRGPWVLLHWREGAVACRLAWWPDTLPAPLRRELRLALMRGEGAPAPPAVAP